MKQNIQPLTRCGDGDITPYVFLCGDPARIPKLTASWEDAQEVCRIREYVIVKGMLEGIPLTAASTGIGGPSTAILIEELAKLRARVFLRVGNSGAIADSVLIGEYVITTGAVRDDGTSKSYVIPEYPAVAHYEVVNALVMAAQESDVQFHTGITWSLDGFYARNKVLTPHAQIGSMSYQGYDQSWMNPMLADMKRAGVKNCEMESGTILTLSNLFGLKAGCICTVSDRTPWPGPSAESLDLDRNMAGCIDIATKAMLRLARAGA
ncbi:MAG TPA: nucleoside phosphorylase [Candidatus Methylomirabilis sp.]|nr:nucleoside phosphorylase [Candidatus Methylomirabilis sp.]